MKKKIIDRIEYDNAQMTKRFASYLIDWYVGALVTAIPISLVGQKLYGTVLDQSILTLPDPIGIYAGLAAIIFAIGYYVLIPTFVYSGQTLGKRFCKIKVVQQDGKDISFKTMVLRQIIGIMIVEGVLVSASTIWHQVFTLATGVSIIQPMMYLGFAISAISIIGLLFDKEKRALHDRIAKTKVIECK